MKKGNIPTVIIVLIFFAGLSLLLYPTFSNYWNFFRQSRAIATYAEEVAELDNNTYDEILSEADKYNKSLINNDDRFFMTDEQLKQYESILNISGNGVIGYIEIPSIDCYLPIYHGADESVLQIAAGHIAGSSLPVGGKGTHSVISGHRGLPSAKLFTDLNKVKTGDTFTIRVLDEALTYEVDQILTVEPQNIEALDIDENNDYCTLVTCTPYGINTHRILVRGHRIENTVNTDNVRIIADAQRFDSIVTAFVFSSPFIFIILLWLIIRARKASRNNHLNIKFNIKG